MAERRHRWYAILIVPVLALSAACSGGSSSPPTSTPSPATAQEDNPAEQAQLDAEGKQAQRRLDALEAQVKAEPSLDKRLSIIVTTYCKLGTDPTQVDILVWFMLPDLFDKYWRAGGKWNYPLGSAVMQQSACPSTPSTTPPSIG